MPTGINSASIAGNEAPEPHKIFNPTNKKIFTVLLIGETGSGKTSFMSLLANIFLGHGPFELEDMFHDKKEQGGSQSQSQTLDATLYPFKVADGTVLQILDTPGLADTRGIDVDNEHKEKINQAIQKDISTIDALLIVANGTVPRLGVATQYTLSTVTAMFPYSIIDNIGFIFTNTDDIPNFDMNSLPAELRKAKYWTIQNPLALYKNYKKIQEDPNVPPQGKARSKRRLEEEYDLTLETLNNWIGWMDSRVAQPTKQILELHDMSREIELGIVATLSETTELAKEGQHLEKVTEELERNQEKAQGLLELINIEQNSPKWVNEPTKEHNTICIAPDCHENCHRDCTLEIGSTDLGNDCVAFAFASGSGGSAICQNPRCRHPASMHRHYSYIHAFKSVQDPKKQQELKNAIAEGKELDEVRRSVRGRLHEIEEHMRQNHEKIRTLVASFNGMSLSRNFAGHIQSTIEILRVRKDALQSDPKAKEQLKVIEESITNLEKELEVLAQ